MMSNCKPLVEAEILHTRSRECAFHYDLTIVVNGAAQTKTAYSCSFLVLYFLGTLSVSRFHAGRRFVNGQERRPTGSHMPFL
jgi:hypothetical protein